MTTPPTKIYNERFTDIAITIKAIERKLKEHKKSFTKKNTDWGYAGDLGYVLEQLKQINNFLH